MIPIKAVEAAADIIRTVDYPDYNANMELARRVLEAAAPQLMAQAWDEGREEGYEAGRDRGTPEQPNPYRE